MKRWKVKEKAKCNANIISLTMYHTTNKQFLIKNIVFNIYTEVQWDESETPDYFFRGYYRDHS